jgi:DNA repair protein RadC
MANAVCFTYDGARRLIKTHTISVGTLTSSLVHPREVFAPAIGDRANSIIIAHNHPSGSLTVGKNGREVTRRIKDAGELFGIKLDEHIIITGDEFASAL